MAQLDTYNGITFYQARNDVNGNRRVVVHFLDIADDYAQARKIANKIRGRVYRGSDFGGGFVFHSYDDQALAERLKKPQPNFNQLNN